MESKPKKILYIGGGVLAGVFSAGVLASLLKDEKIYEKFDAVFASSAGAVVGAYFLANQPEGATIFYDSLIKDFIMPMNFFGGMRDRLTNRFIHEVPSENFRNAVDIEKLFKVVKEENILNLIAVKERNLPLYVDFLDVNDFKTKFVDISKKDDLLYWLRCAVSAVPYYYPGKTLYIDGGMASSFPLEDIENVYPDHDIVAILNIMPQKFMRRFLKGLTEGAVASIMYGVRIWPVFLKRDYLFLRQMRTIKQHKNLTIVSPPNSLNLWPNTTNRKKLLRAFEEGKVAGEKLLIELN
ncbi:MAG: patatin-like phospholipase family protein [Patescibacteria group bacterium]